MTAELACSEMEALAAERASGALDGGDRARLDAHLALCGRCRAELARYEDVFELVRGGPGALLAGGAAPDLASSTLRRWKRRRRLALGIAAGSGALAAAAAVALVLSPSLRVRQPAEEAAVRGELASWEPDVDGALEASGLQRDAAEGQEEDASAVDVVLAAFDEADGS